MDTKITPTPPPPPYVSVIMSLQEQARAMRLESTDPNLKLAAAKAETMLARELAKEVQKEVKGANELAA